MTRIAILGFGTVGSSVVRLVQQKRNQGLQVTHIFNRKVSRKQVDWVGRSTVWTERFEDVLRADVDIVVELVGDVEQAYKWVKDALQAGKHVVTANKQLVAQHGTELSVLARQAGCRIAFGAAVAGVIPVIPAILEGLSADTFHRLIGILNGTSNYVLSRMERDHVAMADAVSEAREKGYAEADPGADLDGHDAAAKLAILVQVAMHYHLPPEQVAMESIRGLEPLDFEYARRVGCTIRQISVAERVGRRLHAAVRPALVALDSPFAANHGSENLVAVYGDYGGRLVFSGAGAGGPPTAVAVVSDLLAIRRGHSPAPHEILEPAQVSADFESRYFLRFVMRDMPGIIAGIAGVLARYRINIDNVLQTRGFDPKRLPFVITLDMCSPDRLREAMKEIGRLRFHVEKPVTLPIFDRF